jgi:hypothetical protein
LILSIEQPLDGFGNITSVIASDFASGPIGGIMGMSDPVQKITFAEMRAAGVRGVLIYSSDYRCSHSTCLDADRWADDVRLSDIEPGFVCTACGQRGADVRPDWPGI